MIWLGALAVVTGVLCTLLIVGIIHKHTATIRDLAGATRQLAIAQAAGLSLARAQVELNRQLVEVAKARQSTIATAMGDPAARH